LRKSIDKKLPESVNWRTGKVGFEPPQQKWMETKAMKEAILEAKKTLVEEKILQSAVLDKPITPHNAHAADHYDWRYFSAASLFK